MTSLDELALRLYGKRAAELWDEKCAIIHADSGILDDADSRIAALEEALGRAKPLLQETVDAHRDPGDAEYNECEKTPCHWCAQALTILAAGQPDTAAQGSPAYYCDGCKGRLQGVEIRCPHCGERLLWTASTTGAPIARRQPGRTSHHSEAVTSSPHKGEDHETQSD